MVKYREDHFFHYSLPAPSDSLSRWQLFQDVSTGSSQGVNVGWSDTTRRRWGRRRLSRAQCCALPVASAAIFSSPVGRCAAAGGNEAIWMQAVNLCQLHIHRLLLRCPKMHRVKTLILGQARPSNRAIPSTLTHRHTHCHCEPLFWGVTGRWRSAEGTACALYPENEKKKCQNWLFDFWWSSRS